MEAYYTIAAIGVGISAVVGLVTILRNSVKYVDAKSYHSGKMEARLETMVTELHRNIQDLRIELKDLQMMVHRAYILTPEEARKYLHSHSNECDTVVHE